MTTHLSERVRSFILRLASAQRMPVSQVMSTLDSATDATVTGSTGQRGNMFPFTTTKV